MSRKYKFHNPDGLYFVSYTVIQWIDVFIRKTYKDQLLECWEYCQINKGLRIHAWCIMTSHVHLIISSEQKLLSDIIRDVKSYSARLIRQTIQQNPQESRKEWMVKMMLQAGKSNSNNNCFQFWQQHNQPIELLNDKMSQKVINYIHQNPVVSGFVHTAKDYPYSSAKDYAGENGYLKVCKIV